MNTKMTDAIVSNNLNPLVEAAKPIFILTNTMQQTVSQLPSVVLLDKIALMVDEFEEQAENNGAKHEMIQAAKYCLCTFVDELAVHAKWADENWSQKSLLVSFYDETWGGERFFEMLTNLQQQPEKNRDLLELMYLCLQFGYKGKYQVLSNGDLQIDKIKRDLVPLFQYQDIHNMLPYQQLRSNKSAQSTSKRLRIPLWVLASLAAVVISISFFTLQRLLAQEFNLTSTEVNNLKLPVPTQNVKLESNHKLAPLLENEINRKLVSVSDLQDRSIVTILGDGLFESGSAAIQDQYFPVLAAVGQALNSAEGQIIVSGYTDDQPIRGVAFPSNWHLSQGRADAVKEILTKYVSQGTTRIRAEGRGETNPVAPNDNPENRAKNRRVEIILFITDKGPRLGTSVPSSQVSE